MSQPVCRFCATPLSQTFCDLGLSPLSNSYVADGERDRAELFYPLHVRICGSCLLVQLPEIVPPEQIFSDYAYFSSYSDSWLEHARHYVESISARLALGPTSKVVEIASNDGYLLQYFRERGVPVLGVEPARNVAEVAIGKGIPTCVAFFGTATALRLKEDGQQADLLLGNNVLAHVPALNDFVGGLKVLLAPDGVVTMEFPHLLRLMRGNQFDTIYHEHYSYFSLRTVKAVFAAHGLPLFDVEELPSHGGSLRIYAHHADDVRWQDSGAIGRLLAIEEEAGLGSVQGYARFDSQVRRTKRGLLRFLLDAVDAGKSVAAYGAPAKGNTLLVYCGVRSDLVAFTVDRSPHKQGRELPGSRIPIHHPDRLRDLKPDYVLILPWNLRDEITQQMAHIREWGGRFVVAIPELEVLP